MKTTRKFQIGDYSGSCINLLQEDPIFEAETGRAALSAYLKKINFKGRVKVSGDRLVHFKVTPIVIQDGRVYIDGSKRGLWYQII